MNMIRDLKDPEEKAIFKEFKKIVSDLEQDDGVIIRFLKARNFDLISSEKMLRNAIKWRTEMGMDDCRKWKFPENYPSQLAYKYSGKDYEGAPICWIFLGKWNGKGSLEKGQSKEILRWAYAMMERGLECTIECDSPGNIIIDMEGLSYSQVGHLPSLKLLYDALADFEQYFPETTKSILVINAPWIFSTGFNFVKGVISPRTMEKIKIFSYNKQEWYAELLDMFPPESIIPELRQ